MSSLLAILLTATTGATELPSPQAPRVLAWRDGAQVQAWPAAPAPQVIEAHPRRPFARPFGPHPGERWSDLVASFAPAAVSDSERTETGSLISVHPQGGWRRVGRTSTQLR